MRRRFRIIAAAAALSLAALALLHFPWDTDAPLSQAMQEKTRQYYAKAYERPDGQAGNPDLESKYAAFAAQAAVGARIEPQVKEFVRQYGLAQAPVLEIGSGRGGLQDVAENYTGLDISPTAARFYRKKFVLGSATAMPFPDSSFEGGWSIWVYEHVPNPEQGFAELRRVMRNGAVFFLFPAWNCPSWAAQGYEVRPYSDFDLCGKLVKASVPLRGSQSFRAVTVTPGRLARRAAVLLFGPAQLHYRRLEPNYREYWVADSDGLNSLDRHEAVLWFTSRGDECLNCGGLQGSFLMKGAPLVIRIRKERISKSPLPL